MVSDDRNGLMNATHDDMERSLLWSTLVLRHTQLGRRADVRQRCIDLGVAATRLDAVAWRDAVAWFRDSPDAEVRMLSEGMPMPSDAWRDHIIATMLIISVAIVIIALSVLLP